ncbi:MAG: uracil phosphoribosyltransferase [Flavobacteriaceae bacterium]
MSWKGFFEGIQSFAEAVLFPPYDAFRLGVENWWASNAVNWVLMLIGVIAFIYWMQQLAKFKANGEE